MGNIVSMATLCSREFRHAPCTALLFLLAVVDTLVLNISGVFECAITKFVFDGYGTVLKIVDYFRVLVKTLSSWTVVLVTFERFVSVMWPLRAGTICSRKKMIVSWLVMLLLAALVWLHPKFYARPRAGQAYFWLRLVLTCAVPFLLIATGNAVIIYNTCTSHYNRMSMTASSASSASNTTALTRMLVIVCVLFLVTTSPIYVLRFLEFMYTFEELHLNWAQYQLLDGCFTVLYHTNNAINSLLYFLSGTRFRNASLKVMCPSRT